MRVLLVGSTSMIGGRLRERLAPGDDVVAAGRGGHDELPFDLAATDAPPDPRGPFDVLIHCAASFGDDRPEERVRNELVNAVGALRVGQLAVAAGCGHLIYLSSLFGYDHPENGYFGSYGLSKRHGQENLALACARAGIGFTALILTQVYDERGEARKHQGLFYYILDCAARGADFTLHGTSDPRRNFLFVEDVATIIERVMAGRVCGLFPCLHPDSPRLSEIAATAYEAFGRGGRVRFDPSRPDPPTVYLPDDLSLYETIGYRPATDLRAGITRIRDANYRD
jgi:nucleoside-diphosphate-sugar epimerase